MSKGLEALYKIANVEMKEQYKATKNGFTYRVISDEYSKELKIIEKELKALEIINRKHVNVTFLKQTFLWSILDEKGLREYNCNFGYDDDGYHSNELTEKEYKLLKEVLK
jgi:hypothetical protein